MRDSELLAAIHQIYPEFMEDLEQAYLVHVQLSKRHGIVAPTDGETLDGDAIEALGDLLADVELDKEGQAQAELVHKNIRAISFIERLFEVLVERKREKDKEAVSAVKGEDDDGSIIRFPGDYKGEDASGDVFPPAQRDPDTNSDD